METLTQYEREARLIYSVIVAGKSANFADIKTREFLNRIAVYANCVHIQDVTPFEMLRCISKACILAASREAKTGNYFKLTNMCFEIIHASFDLLTVTAEQLETIHGVGPKTSRFFILWTRPETHGYAALDVHVLRWLAAQGWPDIPPATPQSKSQYRRIELLFLDEAKKRGLTPRELDARIWEAGARRTQTTALPNGRHV